MAWPGASHTVMIHGNISAWFQATNGVGRLSGVSVKSIDCEGWIGKGRSFYGRFLGPADHGPPYRAAHLNLLALFNMARRPTYLNLC